jgi:hypothetical protein
LPTTLSFFPSFISLSYFCKYTMILIFFCYFKFIPFEFWLLFFSYFFFWSFVCFQFNPWFLICIYKVFQFGPFTFNFLIYFSLLF